MPSEISRFYAVFMCFSCFFRSFTLYFRG